MENAYKRLFFAITILASIFTVVSSFFDLISLTVLQKILLLLVTSAFIAIACIWPNYIAKFKDIPRKKKHIIIALLVASLFLISMTVILRFCGKDSDVLQTPTPSAELTVLITPTITTTRETPTAPTGTPFIEATPTIETVTPTNTVPLPTATTVVTFSAETMAAYQNGKNYYDENDFEAAYPLLLEAAQAGHSNAQLYTGICLQQEGVSGGDGAASAAEWFLLASNQGNDQAQYELGKCFLAGDGVVKNYETAFNCFMESASHENKNGLLWAGFCYHYGLGVTQDFDKAMEYYLAAQEQGHTYAKVRIQKLLVDMQNAE